MTDYTKGQIYKIVDSGFTKCYIGSTVQKLSYRMAGHRRDYDKYLNGNSSRKNSIFNLFDEFGIENCKIELIEKYPCESKEELLKREGHHQRENECINKLVAGRTPQEYYQDKKEHIKQTMKNYREQYPERIKDTSQKYYINKREYILQQKTVL